MPRHANFEEGNNYWLKSPGFLKHHVVTPGKRYIYFKTLPLAKVPTYWALYDAGMDYLSEIKNQLTPQDLTKNLEFKKQMESYIGMISELAANERQNEIEFVQNFKKILSQDKTNELPARFEEYVNDLTNNFDYIKLINLINEMMSGFTNYDADRERIAKENMSLITKNYESASEDVQKAIMDAHSNENYGKFIAIAKNTLLKDIKGPDEEILQKYQTSVSSLFSRKFNSIFYNIVESKEMSDKIGECWKNNWNNAPDTLKKYMIGIVSTYLLELDFNTLAERSGKEMAQDIVNRFDELSKQINLQYTENMINLINGKMQKSLEEVALTSSRGLGQMFLDLTLSAQKEVKRKYKQYGFDITEKELDKMRRKSGATAYERSKIAKKLGDAIRRAAEEQFGKGAIENSRSTGDTLKQQKLLVEALKKMNPMFFEKRQLADTVENILKIKIDGPSAAEFFASGAIEKALGKEGFVPGKKIQLKTDASVTFSYTPIDFSKYSNTSFLEERFENWGKEFLTKYNIKSGGTTDARAAEEIFREMMNDTLKDVEEIVKNIDDAEEEKESILKQLSNYVNTSISVKEYTYGNNKMGFTGGSLGATSQKVIDNIDTMYELGGISSIDAEDLKFAVANCAPEAIGSDLKENIENYLLGGAAMLMFDDGFAMTSNYMEKMKKEFHFMPKLLHLYAIQGKYIPASLIYTSISQALQQAYFEIETEMNEVYTYGIKNKVTIVNNVNEQENVKNKFSPYEPPWDYAQKRFDEVWKNDIPNIEIKFTFLAGLLDIFEAIPNAFANI